MSLLRSSNFALAMLENIEREVEANGADAIPEELRAVLVEDTVKLARSALRLARVFHGSDVG